MVAGSRTRSEVIGRTKASVQRSRRRKPLLALAFLAAVASAVVIIGIGSAGLPVQRASADPAHVLTLAGRAEAKQPDVVPRADQYWYVAEDGGYQAWLSMDGTHDSLVITDGRRIPVPGCRNGMQAAVPNSGQQVPCVVDPAFLSDAPTNPAAMKAYLAKRTRGAQDPNQTGGDLMTLLQFHYLRPAARAAVFDVAASLPGLQLTSPGSNGVSANQVGVSWPRPDGYASLVFDSRTHGFVGVATGSATAGGNTGATGVAGVAGPTFGIVDHIDELP